jgi:succinate dehydrogenase / fumarate reductase iron-sulfur subunit
MSAPANVTFKIWRTGGDGAGKLVDYTTEASEGMVVLDVVHKIQATQANDLACRWNCKAGKCGSCSAEINGKPSLMCMTRLDMIDVTQPVTIQPMRAFPAIRDLVTDVSWNFRVKKKIKPFNPRPPDAPDGTWRMEQQDVDRVQEFRKCIECFLCQDVCHVLRDHNKHDEFIGPRFLVYTAALEMHPLDTEDRVPELKQAYGIGYCNITKCCTKVCPEHITITDNAIIPLKERVVDDFFDPLGWLWKLIRPKG